LARPDTPPIPPATARSPPKPPSPNPPLASQGLQYLVRTQPKESP
jgi:hypothetical protein